MRLFSEGVLSRFVIVNFCCGLARAGTDGHRLSRIGTDWGGQTGTDADDCRLMVTATDFW